MGDFVAEAVGFPGEVEGAEVGLVGAAELFADVGAGEAAESEEIVEHTIGLENRAAPVAFARTACEFFYRKPARIFAGLLLRLGEQGHLRREALLLHLILHLGGQEAVIDERNEEEDGTCEREPLRVQDSVLEPRFRDGDRLATNERIDLRDVVEKIRGRGHRSIVA